MIYDLFGKVSTKNGFMNLDPLEFGSLVKIEFDSAANHWFGILFPEKILRRKVLVQGARD